MKSSRLLLRLVATTSTALLLAFVTSTTIGAEEAGTARLRFQKPGRVAEARAHDSAKRFRRPTTNQQAEPKRPAVKVAVRRPKPKPKPPTRRPAPRRKSKAVVAKKKSPAKRAVKRDPQVDLVVDESPEEVEYDSDLSAEFPVVGPIISDDGYLIGEPGCGIGEPGCGIVEPRFGFAESGLRINGCGDGVGRGRSCVARPGGDYWCFPVCLPKFKDLSVWAGVQGFRGPRDFTGGRSDSNFGFHQGINISGRAPLIGLLFPQLSYQLGYQAVQSRLDGTATSPDDRSQQFVTVGLFRRVRTGLQFGVVWDTMRDDLDEEIDLQQIRTEISLKSPLGREIGFWSATSTNSDSALGVAYETIDQYAGFYRWNFGNGYNGRIWGGASGNGQGIFGADFTAPLNDRWSLQTGFNYLIPDQSTTPAAVQEESWNLGMRLVWHLGNTAKQGGRSPYRPMFSVADNGWMLVDRAQ